MQQAFNITSGHYSTCPETGAYWFSPDLNLHGLNSVSVRKVIQMYKHNICDHAICLSIWSEDIIQQEPWIRKENNEMLGSVAQSVI